MSSQNVVHIKGPEWKAEVLDSQVPVLVDFWAQWCGPCKMIAPILDELAVEFDGKIKIAKVDVDENRELAVQFGIRSIPTLLIFKGGVVQEQMVGASTKATLKAKLSAHI